MMKLISRIWKGFRGVFSPRIEDSHRLRAIALLFIWLGAAGLFWAGGSPWFTLGGAGLATLGHGISWLRRRKPSRLLPFAISGLIITASFLMRGQMLEALSGNWIPLGQFLIMVQAISSFDMRTRGGLYTSIVLTGITLFFASQQAFDGDFSVFIIGFMVLLLAFLAVGFLEDGVRGAKVHWRRHQPSIVLFWVGMACAVFLMSGLAFWVMPRGQTNLGLPDVAILPFSSNSLDSNAPRPHVNPASIPLTPKTELPEQGQPVPSSGSNDEFSGPGGSAGESGFWGDGEPSPEGGFQGNLYGREENGDVVFYVRSKVASYWRGSTMDIYDGEYWRESGQHHNLTPSNRSSLVWHNRESFGLDNRLRYGQTFFIQKDRPNTVFTGYRGVRVIAEDGSLSSNGVRAGDSYRVLSAHPMQTPERLQESHARGTNSRYLLLPPNSARLRELARQITAEADTDFTKVQNIIAYLDSQQRFDRQEPGHLTSSATLNEFLFEDKPGTAMDYATATVMLARGAGLPSRLAMGYLPGTRDPLSGAYMVRESDAHAWAEVYFEDLGWVPVDSAPRPDITLLFNEDSGVGYLLGSGFSEEAYQAVKATPSKLASLVTQGLGSQGIMIALSAVSFAIFIALGWRRFWWSGNNRKAHGGALLAYSGLPGEGRREFLQVYRRAEKTLTRAGQTAREPWQTAEEYRAQVASESPMANPQLEWFTAGAWHAAYDPEPFPSQMAATAKQKLRELKAALKQKS